MITHFSDLRDLWGLLVHSIMPNFTAIRAALFDPHDRNRTSIELGELGGDKTGASQVRRSEK